MVWVLYILAADAIAAGGRIDWNTTVTGVLALVGTIAAGVFAVMMAKINASANKALQHAEAAALHAETAKRVAAEQSEIAKKAASEQSIVIGKIETEVNSKTSRMETEMKELRRELAETKEAKATLMEQKRGQETKEAVAAAVAQAPAQTAPSQISSVELSPAFLAQIVKAVKESL